MLLIALIAITGGLQKPDTYAGLWCAILIAS